MWASNVWKSRSFEGPCLLIRLLGYVWFNQSLAIPKVCAGALSCWKRTGFSKFPFYFGLIPNIKFLLTYFLLRRYWNKNKVNEAIIIFYFSRDYLRLHFTKIKKQFLVLFKLIWSLFRINLNKTNRLTNSVLSQHYIKTIKTFKQCKAISSLWNISVCIHGWPKVNSLQSVLPSLYPWCGNLDIDSIRLISTKEIHWRSDKYFELHVESQVVANRFFQSVR